jgi:prepilin peptidase CpaA
MISGPIIEVSVWVLKAAAILMLARIAYVDFLTLRIRNEHVLALFAVALAILVFDYMQSKDIARAGILVAASALVFILLVIFWMLRKVGAGDVKLLAIMPLLVGLNSSITFVLALLVLTLLIYGAMKFPMLLPAQLYRVQLDAMRRDGKIPFGVPIALAAIAALLIPIGALPVYRAAPDISELTLSGFE